MGWNLLLSVALKSTVVLGAAWVVAFLLRRRSAATRHLVWTAAAAAVLAMPLLAIVLPALRVPASRAFFPFNTGVVFQITTNSSGSGSASGVPGPAAAPSSAPVSSPWRPDPRAVLTLAWALGTAVLWMQMLAAYAAMRRVRRNARIIGWSEDVPVLETATGGMPMTFGVRDPAIFLPADAAHWTDDRRQLVLLHELAHVRRGDTATHLIARAALALNWWNPLAWIAWREFLKERERAADDLVLNSGAQPSEYAGHLLEVARSLQSPRPTAWAAVAMARRSQIEGRLLAILDSGVNRKESGRAAVAAATVLAVLLAAPFAAMRAQAPAPQALPEVHAAVQTAFAQRNPEQLEQAAAAYEKAQLPEVAQTLLESALELRGQISGPQSPSYAIGLINLGDLSQRRRNYGNAEEFYTKAIALGDRPETVRALLYLAKASYPRNGSKTLDLLQRALNADPAGPLAGQAMTWIAMVKQTTPEGAAEAESMYQRALSVEDPKSADAATTMELYARFLRLQGRQNDALNLESRARENRQSRMQDMSLAPPSTVYKVGGGTSAPVLLHKLEPAYTEEARAAKLAGTVIVYAEIGPDGVARNMRITKGVGLGLDEKAIEAIGQWQFQPGTRDGLPVTVAATIEVNFKLM